MKTKCPNCGAGIKTAGETSNYFSCGSSDYLSGRPEIRCTKGETSTPKKIILKNSEGRELTHNLWTCSDAYARAFVAQELKSLTLVRIESTAMSFSKKVVDATQKRG